MRTVAYIVVAAVLLVIAYAAARTGEPAAWVIAAAAMVLIGGLGLGLAAECGRLRTARHVNYYDPNGGGAQAWAE